MTRRHSWQPTIVRSCELGFIKMWDECPPEAPFVHYSVLRRADGKRTKTATYQEAMDFINNKHCPVLDLYPNQGATNANPIREDRSEQPANH